MKWSMSNNLLASGGNDNKLFIWSAHSTTPICKFSSHTAAVKGIAWSPHNHGVLASGGGSADKTIKFWNTLCLLYTSPSPRDLSTSRMPSSA